MPDPMTGDAMGAVSSPATPSVQPITGAATSIRGQARQQLTGVLERQKSAAADVVERLAETVQRSSEPFQGRQDWIAGAVGRGAEELHTFARSLRDKDLGELAGHLGSFARAQPAVFIGGAFAAGFAIARLGKVVAGGLSHDDLPTMPEVGHGRR